MSETIVRSSPYRRSDCITIVCLLELKSAAQRYLFVVCSLLRLGSCVMRSISGVWSRWWGGWPKFLPAVARMDTHQILGI